MELNLTVLIVIYNKLLSDSTSLSSLIKHGFSNKRNINIIIWDNSSDDIIRNNNLRLSSEFNIKYILSNTNTSLSVVYNEVISNEDSDYYIISDDDSDYSSEYLNSLEEVFSKRILIAIPKIYANGILFSPALLGAVVGKHLSDINPGFHSDIIGVMSGTIISKEIKSIFNKSDVFDEKLSFYGVDTDFFLSLSKYKIPIYVLDCSIEHDLAMCNKSYKSSELFNFRYKNSKLATFYINRKRSYLNYFLTFLYYFLYETKCYIKKMFH
ncbi:glycosyltransferase family 2 protein [Leminorella grimontii]|uniref:glycosyltransferase family 2 protein n=1 Tax=Leminorella grimontii TaxID=82981 RepID=UPI00321FDD23